MTDQNTAPLDLDGLDALLAGATTGPWQNGIDDLEGIVAPHNPGLGNVICLPPKRNMYSSLECWPDNAALIVAAVNALPTLISQAREAERMRVAETWATMAKWTEETFGPVSLERIATRANEEMQELLSDPSDVMEAADVCIVLSRYPGIADAIDRKMAINRKREWRLNGDGSGYHVKQPQALAPATGGGDA